MGDNLGQNGITENAPSTAVVKHPHRFQIGNKAALKHGLRSNPVDLLRQHPEIKQKLRVVKRGLVSDLSPEGEEHLTMARRLVLERMLSKLGRVYLIEYFLDANGIINRPSLEKRHLAAEPIMATWSDLNESIRRDLAMLGMNRKSIEAVQTPDEMLEDAHADVVAQDAVIVPKGDGDA